MKFLGIFSRFIARIPRILPKKGLKFLTVERGEGAPAPLPPTLYVYACYTGISHCNQSNCSVIELQLFDCFAFGSANQTHF